MAHFNIPLGEVFAKPMKDILEERIEKVCEKARTDAINRIQKEIENIIAATVVSIFEQCSFERLGPDLRITVDTSKLFKAKEEK